MAVNPYALDVGGKQCFTDAFHDFLALGVEHFQVAAEQHFA